MTLAMQPAALKDVNRNHGLVRIQVNRAWPDRASPAMQKRVLLIAVMLSGVSAAVCAQSADKTVTGSHACFQSALGADLICSDPGRDAVQRLDCFQKARTALLECLEQAGPKTSAGATASENTDTTGALAAPSGTASPEIPAATIAPEKPTAAVSSTVPASAVNMRDADWVVSETTSPVDYAPMITATIGLPSGLKHAPAVLAIRCRGGRTELLIRTDGTWRASPAGEIEVDYQINDQSVVRLRWIASADRKTASYKSDAVGFLQSLPEGAQLKINVLDGPGPRHEATFQLAGLDAVRAKIAAACHWMPTAKIISSKY